MTDIFYSAYNNRGIYSYVAKVREWSTPLKSVRKTPQGTSSTSYLKQGFEEFMDT